MPVIDTEQHGLRGMTGYARRVRFEPGLTSGATTLTATNVQDAIDQLLSLTNIGDVDPYLLVAGGQTTTGGFQFTAYNMGTGGGTVTPAAYNGNYQFLSNAGAFTLAAPAADCAIDILIINASGAGAITFTGFTVGASTGDALDTTSGHKFICSIRMIDGVATYLIKALQ